MPETITDKPMDILDFTAMENKQLMVSLVNREAAFDTHSHLQRLFAAPMNEMNAAENDMVIFQLLAFVHYHFLFSTACLLRCHLSEAFASARAAIDAALIAAHIIEDRASQIAYVKREKPFDNYARYLGNRIRSGKKPPHPLVPGLFQTHKKLSTFSAHADFGSFAHRVTMQDHPDGQLAVYYFQFSKDPVERKSYALRLYRTFIDILDVFSDFLVEEQKAVPPVWHQELRALGARVEAEMDEGHVIGSEQFCGEDS